MKNKRLSFILIFSFVMTLLLAGCTKNFSYDSSNSNLVPDGISFDFNYDQNITINYDDQSQNSSTVDEDDSSDEIEVDEYDSSEDEENDEPDENGQNDSEVNISDNDSEDENADNPDDENNVDDEDSDNPIEDGNVSEVSDGLEVSEDGQYTSKEEVALYIHLYKHLPSNYITKKEAQALGWDSGKGNLNEVAKGKSIGGDRFGNREKLLPIEEGRLYYECDIDYVSGTRNAKRIVYSNDGLVYYTEDHYETFELLYK